MFEPHNRSLLTDSLQPPRGYELLQAVGTTFTLDLATALSVPLSFASKSLVSHHDLGIIAALTRFTDRITLFTQAGEIRPGVRSDLVALLEPVLHTVHPGRGIFHPKVWILEFASGDKRAYRLLSLSRNLTEDRSWDLSIRLDGVQASDAGAEAAHERNLPLRSFLRGLCVLGKATLDDTRTANIRGLAERLLNVEWELPRGVTGLKFHVLSGSAHDHFETPEGTTPQDSVANMLDFDAAEALIISPFLSEEGLSLARRQVAGRTTVVSRAESIDSLPSKIFTKRLETYVLDAQLSESGDFDAETPETLSGLHAKAIFFKRRRYSSQSRALIGSANVTGGGLRNNVEFMVELEGHSRDFAPANVLAELAPMLEPHRSTGGAEPSASEEARHRLEARLRALAGKRFHARVVAGEPYSMRVWCEPEGVALLKKLQEEDVSISWCLNSRPGDSKVLASNEIEAEELTHLALTQVTPFIHITLKQRVAGEEVKARTLVMATLHDDVSARRDAILAHGITGGDQFLRLLALLLDPEGMKFDLKAGSAGESAGNWSTATLSRGLFEAMLGSLANGDEGLDVVHRIYTELRSTDDLELDLPEGFTELWQSVWDARNASGQERSKR